MVKMRINWDLLGLFGSIWVGDTMLEEENVKIEMLGSSGQKVQICRCRIKG